ncbi:hypothetical protein QBC44DRAFT_387163 [Cladorrhinum sp. PSN332]|nr:hypothetical protein QBC44DRAFT_387163 [Cladorrhinum sp. PSN332]
MFSSTPISLILTSLLLLLLPFSTLAQNTTSTTITTVLQIFFLNDRIQEEGLPYTYYTPKISGSVLAVDAVSNLTTFVITSTRSRAERPTRRPFHSSHSDADSDTADGTSPPTETITPAPYSALSPTAHHPGPGGGHHGNKFNATGQPTTITQGPNTFQFTGTRYGPNHSLINRCTLNGTLSAACNMTYLGTAWYARDSAWNGTFSTYSYNWTRGDRFGYAPVTVTAGAELLVGEGPGRPTPPASSGSSASSLSSLSGPHVGILMAVGLAVVTLGSLVL